MSSSEPVDDGSDPVDDGVSSDEEPQVRGGGGSMGEEADTTDESEVPQGEGTPEPADEALLSILDEDYRVTRSLDDYRRRWGDDSDSSDGGEDGDDEDAPVDNHYEQLGDEDFSEFVYVPRTYSPEPEEEEEEEESKERRPADPPRISVAPLSRGEYRMICFRLQSSYSQTRSSRSRDS